MAFTLDTTLGTLLDHPQAKAIIEKYAPGIATNPMVGMIKGLSLSAILAMPQAVQYGLTKEKVEKVLAEINKVAGKAA
jgi:tetrahydromethanopterin S-methyltransferase subunit B